MEKYDVNVKVIAIEAPWQHGMVERHGQVLQEIFDATVEDSHVQGWKEVEWACRHSSRSKNVRPGRFGFFSQPNVFGREQRVEAGILDAVLEGRGIASQDRALEDKSSDAVLRYNQAQ